MVLKPRPQPRRSQLGRDANSYDLLGPLSGYLYVALVRDR